MVQEMEIYISPRAYLLRLSELCVDLRHAILGPRGIVLSSTHVTVLSLALLRLISKRKQGRFQSARKGKPRNLVGTVVPSTAARSLSLTGKSITTMSHPSAILCLVAEAAVPAKSERR